MSKRESPTKPKGVRCPPDPFPGVPKDVLQAMERMEEEEKANSARKKRSGLHNLEIEDESWRGAIAGSGVRPQETLGKNLEETVKGAEGELLKLARGKLGVGQVELSGSAVYFSSSFKECEHVDLEQQPLHDGSQEKE